MKRFYIAFIDGIKQPQWFSLISLLFVLPFAAVMYYEISAVNERIDFVKKERMGVEYIQSTVRFLQDFQQHRGMSYAYLSGDTSFAESIKRKRIQLEDEIRAIDSVEEKYGKILKTTERWNELREKWRMLEDRNFSLPPQKSFDDHTALIDDILSLILYIRDTSNLILDPFFDSYYMMDTGMNRIPLLTENLGRIRGMGAGVIMKGEITEDEKIRLIILLHTSKSAIDMIEYGLKIISGENPELKPKLENLFHDAISSTNTFLSMMNNRIINVNPVRKSLPSNGVKTNIPSGDYFAMGTAAIDANFKLYDAITLNLDRSLQFRIDRSYRIKYSIVASLIFIFVVLFSVFNRFRHSLKRQIEADEQLKVLLHEKEVLLKEVHHRVKNNLQVISSLFNIQSGHIKDKEQAIRVFEESQNRIRSMAIIHEKLYKTGGIYKINFSEYLNDLTANIFRSYSSISSGIRVKIKADDILLNIDIAIPLGLIVNELVLNSIKYAFPDKREGEILIELRSDKDGYLLLVVGDNGIGLPEGMDIGNTESLGLQLVNTLVGQLKGTIDVNPVRSLHTESNKTTKYTGNFNKETSNGVNIKMGTEFKIRFDAGGAK
ncbi:MAG: nitrate- and nitrite sensing domain-containing protein [Nitrospinae bacterium]|nr:nitrate- and nitrite sensing domain-containing protein [Nitrospinota bacterium]